MPKIPTLLEMLKAGVHFGHRTSRWHPKMAPFIFGSRQGVHVINIEKTQVMLEKALTYIEETTARGGTVMIICTKKQTQDLVEKFALEAGAPYVNTRWLGGTFTNFSVIEKLINAYIDLKDKREKGELKKYTKLEQLQFDRRIDELKEKIGGITNLKKLPDAIFVLDVLHDKTAVVEARKRHVTIVAICDTNVNPDYADYLIPANDDSVQSLTMMLRLVSDAIKVGKARAKAGPAKIETKGADIKLKQEAKETVDDLDDKIKDELAKEEVEAKK